MSLGEIFKNKKVIFLRVVFSVAIFLLVNFEGSIDLVRASDLININTANLEELDTLPGIGPVTAQKIIDYRQAVCLFACIDDITNVSGIGEATFANIKDLITVDETAGGDLDEDDDNEEGEGDETESGCYFDLVINEVLPDPDGSDDGEWIEIKNIGSETVNLSGYKVSDATDNKFELTVDDFANLDLAPDSWLVILKEKSGIALNNSGEESIKLFCPDETLIQEVVYTDSITGASWARFGDSYAWTTSLTPGETNELVEPVDEENGGSGSSGSSDDEQGEEKSSQSKYSEWHGKVFINEVMANPPGLDPWFEWIEISNSSTANIVIKNWKIKEDNGEYKFDNIKLKPWSYYFFQADPDLFQLDNFDSEIITLTDSLGLLVDEVSYKGLVAEGETLNHCDGKLIWLAEPTLMASNACPPVNTNPKAYFDTSIDEVPIDIKVSLDARESFDTDGEIVDYKWTFGGQVQEMTWNFVGAEFHTIEPLFEVKFLEPGKTKITLEVVDDLGGVDKFTAYVVVTEESGMIELEVENLEPVEVNEDLASNVIKSKNRNTSSRSGSIFTKLKDIRNLMKGTKVTTRGLVSVEPGILGVNIFYLQGSGLQVYMSSKDFPDLEVGDEVELSGEISEAYNETRIKVKNKTDYKIISNNNEIKPYKIAVNAIDEEYEGSLVEVGGQVVEMSGNYFYIDDGSAEVKVYFKNSLEFDWKDFDLKEGQELQIVAIVSETTSGYRLLPRYASDIHFLDSEQAKIKLEQTGAGQVLGQKDKRMFGWRDYLLVLLVGVIGVLVVYIGWAGQNQKNSVK